MQATIPPVATDPLETIADVLWRLYPHTFAERCGLVCDGGRKFVSTGLARFLGRTIARAVAKPNARVIINVAPRQGKSEVCSYATPTWMLDNWPSSRVIISSHTAELALNFGRRVRNAFNSNDRLSTSLREDSKAAGRWNTTEGGGMYAVGVGGSITGFGGDLLLTDDPHRNWADAQSPTKRRAVAEWFDNTLMSRCEPGGSVLLIMQRWHNDDLTGHLLARSKEPWQVIRLPALALANDPMGRAIGEPVCPERFDRGAMERIRDTRPRVIWDGNYQQDPQASGDGRVYGPFVRADHVRSIETALRDDLPLQLAWDFNKNPGVHCLLGQYDRKADLLTTRHEIFGERFDTPKTMAALKSLFDAIGAFRNGRFRWPACEVYGDRSGKSPNTVTADTDYGVILRALKDWGVPVKFRVPDANPPIKNRVMATNDAFRDASGKVHYLVHPDCRRLIRDYEEVTETDDGLIDKERDTDLTHPSDAEGYRIWYQRPINQAPKSSGRVGLA